MQPPAVCGPRSRKRFVLVSDRVRPYLCDNIHVAPWTITPPLSRRGDLSGSGRVSSHNAAFRDLSEVAWSIGPMRALREGYR